MGLFDCSWIEKGDMIVPLVLLKCLGKCLCNIASKNMQ